MSPTYEQKFRDTFDSLSLDHLLRTMLLLTLLAKRKSDQHCLERGAGFSFTTEWSPQSMHITVLYSSFI